MSTIWIAIAEAVSSAVNVVLKVLVFHAQPVVVRLDDIANRDDADEVTVFQYRQVADPILGHPPHDQFDFVVGGRDNDFGGHARFDQRCVECSRIRCHGPHQVAFGDHPDHAIAIADNQRPAVVLDQSAASVGERRLGGDRMDERALIAQDVSQDHRGSLDSKCP